MNRVEQACILRIPPAVVVTQQDGKWHATEGSESFFKWLDLPPGFPQGTLWYGIFQNHPLRELFGQLPDPETLYKQITITGKAQLFHLETNSGVIRSIKLEASLLNVGQNAEMLLVFTDYSETAKIKSENNQLKTELETTRLEFDSIFEQSPDAIFRMDTSGCFTRLNLACSELAEMELNEILNQSFARFIHPQDLELVNRHFLACLAGQTIRYQCRIITNKNTEKVVEVVNMPMKTNGTVTGLFGIIKDITLLKTTKKALKESQMVFEYAAKANFNAIWDYNIVTEKAWLSDMFTEMFGYPTGNMVHNVRIWHDNIHPSDKTEIIDLVTNAVEGNSLNWEAEYRFIRADGSLAYRLDRATIIRDENGKAIRMIGAIQDITRQKEKEREANLFMTIVQNLTEGVLISDAEPVNEPGPVIIFANAAFEKMTGYASHELIGKNPRILQGPKTDRQALSVISQALHKWEPVEETLLNYNKNGQEFWNNLSITPVADKNGWFTHWVSIQKDVTERKQAEKEKELYFEILSDLSQNELEIAWPKILERLGKFGAFESAQVWKVNFDESALILQNQWFANKNPEPPLQHTLLLRSDEQAEPVKVWNLGKIKSFISKKPATAEFQPTSQHSQTVFQTCHIPIKAGNKVLAVITLFQNRPNSIHLSNLFDVLQNNLGLHLQRIMARAELDRFFQMAPDLLVIYGTDGRFKKVNSAFSKLTGYSEAELTGRPFMDFIHPDDLPTTGTENKVLASGKMSESFTNRYITSTGRVKYLTWNARPIPGEDLVYGVARDITEAKKINDEKLEILASISDSFYALDSNLCFTYVNQAAHKLMELVIPGEIIGRNIWDCYPMLVKTEFYKKMYECLETRKPVHFEFCYEAEDKWYDESFYPTENGISVFFRSINDRKKAENEIKKLYTELQWQAEALQVSNRELEQFAYVASHDLQEPLRMVSSFLHQLERKYKDRLDEKAQQYIHFAVDGAQRMRSIIMDLLDYSRVGLRGEPYDNVDLNLVLEEVVRLNQQAITDTGAVLNWEPLPVIKAAKISLIRIFHNLLGNAIKYQRKGNQPLVNIAFTESDQHWIFHVSDNGIGIDIQHYDRIFVIFHRLHSREEYPGTGMGLAITKKIVENQGGSIWVDSEPGQGSTFHFSIRKQK